MIESSDRWFLLYGGTSCDGAGPGKYIGRTLDVDEARKHFLKCRKNPYSTGKVEIITDTEHHIAWLESDFDKDKTWRK